MLKRVCMTPGKRYMYTVWIDSNIIYSEWGCRLFLFHKGGFAKIS